MAHGACLSVELNIPPNRQFPAHFVVNMPSHSHVLFCVAHPLHSNQGGGRSSEVVPLETPVLSQNVPSPPPPQKLPKKTQNVPVIIPGIGTFWGDVLVHFGGGGLWYNHGGFYGTIQGGFKYTSGIFQYISSGFCRTFSQSFSNILFGGAFSAVQLFGRVAVLETHTL